MIYSFFWNGFQFIQKLYVYLDSIPRNHDLMIIVLYNRQLPKAIINNGRDFT